MGPTICGVTWICCSITVGHFSPLNGSSAASHVFPENPMSRNRFAAVASLIFVLSSVSGASRQTQAPDTTTTYPTMAPLDQYLMTDRNAEIALARSAAPT